MSIVKHIGVSNFSIEMLERIRYCNQVECHLYLSFCKMYIEFFSCIGHAHLTGPHGVPVLNVPVLEEVAKETGKTTMQIELRFLNHLSPYNVVIPISMNPVNIKANVDLDFTLSDSQMNKLRCCDFAFRFVDPVPDWGVDAFKSGRI